MRFHAWTFVLQTANFLVLVWLLRRFLWRPLLAAVDRRRQETERALGEAEAAKKTANLLQESLARERDAIADERDVMLARAQADAEAARQHLLTGAQVEAAEAMSKAHDDIERAQAQAADELHKKAAELGVALARRLLEAAEATGVTPRLLEEALDALPAELDASDIEIVAARPLSAPERAHCLERLHGVEVRFAVDPSLIAGVELRFGSSILHHSWRDALANAQRELSSDGDAR